MEHPIENSQDLKNGSKRQVGIVDVVNIAGSVASITGISLLWMKEKIHAANLLFSVPVVASAAFLSLGLVATAFVAIRFYYFEFFASRDNAIKVMYFGFSAGVTLILLLVAESFIYGFARIMIENGTIL